MTSKWDLKSCIHSAPLSELYAASSSGVCQSVCPALKVKQDVFSGRRPFQSLQIPDNLSKFLISASNNSALFVPPTVCSKVGNRRGNLGHSSPRCEQSIPSNSAIHKTPPIWIWPATRQQRLQWSERNLRRRCWTAPRLTLLDAVQSGRVNSRQPPWDRKWALPSLAARINPVTGVSDLRAGRMENGTIIWSWGSMVRVVGWLVARN